MSNICTCGGTIYPDSACRTCLLEWKAQHEQAIDALEERMADLNASLEYIEFHLGEGDRTDG